MGVCGSDLIAQAKAGTGKTCVFAVVALEMISLQQSVPQAIILAPTREIAQQIRDVVSGIGEFCPGLKCSAFIGGTSVHRDEEQVRNTHVVVGSPGRVAGLIADEVLNTTLVRLLILDEADKLLHGAFTEQVTFIVSALPDRKQVLAFSATYTRTQRETLSRWMRAPNFVLIDSEEKAGVSLEGVTQFFQRVEDAEVESSRNDSLPPSFARHIKKIESLLQVLAIVPFHQCLIFTNNRSRSQDLVRVLMEHGYPAAAISGDMPQTQRNAAMSRLRALQLRVLVSTDLTARGLDVENINIVINLDLPEKAETYIHRVGRTGRFGTRGLAITLVTDDELPRLQVLGTQLKTDIKPLAAKNLHSVEVDDAAAKGIQSNRDDLKQLPGSESANFNLDMENVAASIVLDDLDASHAKQFHNLQQKRDAVIAAGSGASGEAQVEVHLRKPSKWTSNKASCGLRVSFTDSSKVRKEDKYTIPALFESYGSIASSHFVAGKHHGWIDFARVDCEFCKSVAEQTSGRVKVGRRTLLVQPWLEGKPMQSRPQSEEGKPMQLHTESALPRVGQAVWGRFTEDKKWYPATVGEIFRLGSGADSKVMIALTYAEPYGNFEVLPLTDVRTSEVDSDGVPVAQSTSSSCRDTKHMTVDSNPIWDDRILLKAYDDALRSVKLQSSQVDHEQDDISFQDDGQDVAQPHEFEHSVEKRIDPADGHEYTKDEFVEHYGGITEWQRAFTDADLQSQWQPELCKPIVDHTQSPYFGQIYPQVYSSVLDPGWQQRCLDHTHFQQAHFQETPASVRQSSKLSCDDHYLMQCVNATIEKHSEEAWKAGNSRAETCSVSHDNAPESFLQPLSLRQMHASLASQHQTMDTKNGSVHAEYATDLTEAAPAREDRLAEAVLKSPTTCDDRVVPRVGQAVWGRFTEDKKWYPATVGEIFKLGSGADSKVMIALTYAEPYGNFEVLPLTDVRTSEVDSDGVPVGVSDAKFGEPSSETQDTEKPPSLASDNVNTTFPAWMQPPLPPRGFDDWCSWWRAGAPVSMSEPPGPPPFRPSSAFRN
eukprot:SAG31_NODE_2828_length_5028_cov_6.670116_1_plen_1050_part_00